MGSADTTSFLDGAVPASTKTAQANGNGAPKVQEYSRTDVSTHDVPSDTIKSDVIVIGAGFSGITAIHRFRKQGMSVKCFESGEDFGGVWYWNRYPGARVDSHWPYYQLRIKEIYEGWSFSERFPDHRQLRQYMEHIDKTLDLRKDAYFNARVNSAVWDDTEKSWTIKTEQGHVAQTKYLVLCTGLLHRTYTPDFPGLQQFGGVIMHSGAWDEGFDAKGKKIGLIGAGATAVQITQELGKIADQLTVFLRRPSYCLPMCQRDLSAAETKEEKKNHEASFAAGRDSATGFPVARLDKGTHEATPSEREAFWLENWKVGGFHFALRNYNDTALKPASNRLVYDFWRERVRERLTDPEKAAIMAPEEPPYYFGTKRLPLEQDYYEVLNQPNVHIHSLNKGALKTFTPTGMKMTDGKKYEFDAVILATGFDSFTGSMTRMGLKDKNGVDLADRWKDGVHTYLGLTVSGFPNMFMAYSPHAPTALSNGPTIIEAQVETIVDLIGKLEAEGAKSIEPTEEAQAEWKAALNEMVKYTLFPYTDSWWNGANIPGKKSENYNFIAGIDVYEKQCRATFENGDWKGFSVDS